MNTLVKARMFGATLLTGALLLPQVVSAQMVETNISPMAPWQACLDGHAPSTQNVAPGAMDHDPTHDEMILDFDDDMSDGEVKAWAAQHNLEVSLNSPAADAPNVYIARVAEGAVPYIKDCLTKRDAEEVLEVMEENFEYALFADETTVSFDAQEGTSPNDPLYQFQWHFKQVGAEEAWKTSTGKDVVVSVIDTGVAVKDDAKRGIKAKRRVAKVRRLFKIDR